MATAYTSLLGFALPVTGELNGTWGDVVNNSITSLVESSIAGSATASVASGDWTLTTTGSGVANQARAAILIPTGAPGVSRNIIAPSSSKAFIVVNQSNAAVVLKGSATTGATIAAGTNALVAWNGADFALIAQNIENITGTLPVTKGGTGLTSVTTNRVLYGNGTSALNTSANLTFDGTSLAVSSVDINGGTIDGTAVGASTPSTGAFTNFTGSGTATFTSNEAVKIPVGSTAQRPTPSAGMLRFNSTSGEFEGYSTAWASVGGSAITNDTATATDVYPLFADATSGTAANVYTSNSKLLYKPSTGELKSSVLNAGNGIVINNQTVATSYPIASGENGMSVGPITVASGQTVTVASGSRWVVL